jgi:hypothetical protein
MTNDIRYAQDTSSWTDWQLEYRYGVFLIFPPPGIIEYVDDLRSQYDPASYTRCQAHISLSEPLPRALTDDDLFGLRDAVSGIEQFTITYGDVHTTPPYPGVVYDINPKATFTALRSAVHSIRLFEQSSLTRQDIPPHMTVAEFISMDRSVELAADLRGRVREGNWHCDRIEYAVPDDAMRFQRVLVVPLGT